MSRIDRLGHRLLDPGVDRLATAELAVVMLHVGGVLGEHVGPGAPVARRPRLERGLLIQVEGFLELVATPASPSSVLLSDPAGDSIDARGLHRVPCRLRRVSREGDPILGRRTGAPTPPREHGAGQRLLRSGVIFAASRTDSGDPSWPPTASSPDIRLERRHQLPRHGRPHHRGTGRTLARGRLLRSRPPGRRDGRRTSNALEPFGLRRVFDFRTATDIALEGRGPAHAAGPRTCCCRCPIPRAGATSAR